MFCFFSSFPFNDEYSNLRCVPPQSMWLCCLDSVMTLKSRCSSLFFSYLFIYLPVAVRCQYLPWEGNDDDDKRIRKRGGDPFLCQLFLQFLICLQIQLLFQLFRARYERSFQGGDNADKAGLTSISLKIIWCQSLFICCLLKIVELIQGDVFFLFVFCGGKQGERKLEKGLWFTVPPSLYCVFKFT